MHKSDITPANRRQFPRSNVSVQVAVQTDRNSSPWRTATHDISLCGCYIESTFTFPVGTKVRLTLWLGAQPVETTAVVATSYPQLGNGLAFLDMESQDRLKLHEFLAAAEPAKACGSGELTVCK